MRTTTILTRSLLLVCLLGLLSACGRGEPGTQAELESHGHAHDKELKRCVVTCKEPLLVRDNQQIPLLSASAPS